MAARAPINVRFWRFVTPVGADQCWLWQGCRINGRYVKIATGRGSETELAHRLSWKIHFGPIPEDMKVLHDCDNPPCCNPSHLFLGTQGDNVADMMQKGRHKTSAGEDNSNAKLTGADVLKIRKLHFEGGALPTDIAKHFGVSCVCICRILNLNTWRNLK